MIAAIDYAIIFIFAIIDSYAIFIEDFRLLRGKVAGRAASCFRRYLFH